jgi:hypothetical protein
MPFCRLAGGTNMIVKQWVLRITGRPKEYQIHLEASGEAESLDDLRESMRGLLGNLRITSEEVDADLAASGSYDAYSLPPTQVGQN